MGVIVTTLQTDFCFCSNPLQVTFHMTTSIKPKSGSICSLPETLEKLLKSQILHSKIQAEA